MAKRRIISIVSFILDYAPILITVVAAGLAAFASTRSNVQVSELLQWILVVLAFLVTTQLIDRFKLMRGIESKIEEMSQSQHFKKGVSAVFVRKMPNLESRLRTAKSIAISGWRPHKP